MTDAALDGAAPVVVGRIVGIHGLSGRVTAEVLSDVPHRFGDGQVLYIRDDPYTVSSSSQTSPRLVILKLYGIDSPEAAQGLVGQQVTVPQTSVPILPDGEYFHFQLLGLRVVTEEGEDLGRLSEVLETGSNDVYVVSTGSSELLIPALLEVILSVRLDEGVMLVRLPEGLR